MIHSISKPTIAAIFSAIGLAAGTLLAGPLTVTNPGFEADGDVTGPTAITGWAASATTYGVDTSTATESVRSARLNAGSLGIGLATHVSNGNLYFDHVRITASSSSGPDTTAPVLDSKLPADNATGVATNTNITATFDKAIQLGSGSIANLTGWTQAVHDGTNIMIRETDNHHSVTPGVDRVVVKFKRSSLAPGGKLFARLNVVQTPSQEISPHLLNTTAPFGDREPL